MNKKRGINWYGWRERWKTVSIIGVKTEKEVRIYRWTNLNARINDFFSKWDWTVCLWFILFIGFMKIHCYHISVWNLRSWSFFLPFVQGQNKNVEWHQQQGFHDQIQDQDGILSIRFKQPLLFQSCDFFDHLDLDICPKGRICCLSLMLIFSSTILC